MYCYSIKNKVNGKRYIGVTAGSMEHRIFYKIHNGGSTIFQNAVRKFEWIKDYSDQCNLEELFKIRLI